MGPGSSSQYDDVTKDTNDEPTISPLYPPTQLSPNVLTVEYGFRAKRGTYVTDYSQVFPGETGTTPKMPTPNGSTTETRPSGVTNRELWHYGKWHLNGAQYLQYFPNNDCCLWIELPPGTLNLKKPALTKAVDTSLDGQGQKVWQYIPMTNNLGTWSTPTLIKHEFTKSMFRNLVPQSSGLGSMQYSVGFNCALQLQLLRDDTVIHYRVIPRNQLEFKTSNKQPQSLGAHRQFVMPQADIFVLKTSGETWLITNQCFSHDASGYGGNADAPYSDPDFFYPNLLAVDYREHLPPFLTDPTTRGTISFQAYPGEEYVLATGSVTDINVTQTPIGPECIDLEQYAVSSTD
jgi:hypothetical protein